MLSRREIVCGAMGLALSPACAQAQSANPRGAALTELLDGFMQRALAAAPQLLTMTGLDTGPNAAARSQLDDRSPEGLARYRSLFADLRAALAQYDPASLGGMDWINHQSAAYLVDTALESFGFGFGDPDVGVAFPYIVSQLSGAYRSIQDFLASQHPVETAADAEAYLSRLSAFAGRLDQETARMRADVTHGVVPPDFIIRTTLVQLRELMQPGAAGSDLVTALTRRTTAKGIQGEWETRAARIVQTDVHPALERQAQALSDVLSRARSDAGVWKLPELRIIAIACARRRRRIFQATRFTNWDFR